MAKDAHVAVPRWRWIGAVGLVALVIVAGLAWFLIKDHGKAAQPAATAAIPAPAVGVRPVVTKGVSQSFEFVGRIKATDKVELRARIEGFLEKVLFKEGQDVKTGDLLYQIEKVQFQALVEQAKGNLTIAQAELTNAQLQYDRAVDLAKRQFSPQSQVDQDKAALDSAKGKVLQMKAALTQAETNLDYTDIRAPIDGRIGRTAFTVGNLVNPASGVLATIVSQDPIYVLFPVSVRDLETIREARRKEGGGLAKIDIRVRLSNGQDYPHPGVWNLTDPQVDQQTDSLIMRAIIPNPERNLIDGQFVTAIIQERKEEPRLVVPQSALQVDQNVIVDGIQKVRPGQVVQETMLPPKVGG
jgi:membrane fusion protein (multidrug efflux system)